jgi:hypothetical protein
MSNENITITMLGTTGSGKTCFMVGMYAVMQLGVHGFTLSAQDSDEDIDLSDKWEQLLEGGEDRYPRATDQTHDYAFDFSYGFRKLMGFEWLDYRGAALKEKSTQADVQKLKENLLGSSCIFLCISGEDLVNPSQILALAKKTKADRMNQYLSQLEKPVPVVIAITKYDYCIHRDKNDIFKDIQQLFGALFTKGGEWLVMICPVSLGKALATDTNEGIIEPVNLHLPLAFAIYSKYCQQISQRRNEENSLSRDLKDLKEKNFIMRWLKSEEIQQKDNALKRTQQQTNELQEKMRLLASELGRVPVYLNGEETEIDL